MPHSHADDDIVLNAGAARLGLRARAGGAVSFFEVGEYAVLRPAAEGDFDPLNQGAFPLFPFSGRIDQGHFTFQGQSYTLPANFPPEPHAIHGDAWQSPWRAEVIEDNSAALIHDHDGKFWPWTYRAEQAFSLTPNSLTLAMSLTNTDTRPMPAGFGWHPYFPSHGARLSADITQIWESGADMIPAAPTEPEARNDLRTQKPLEDLALDNCFSAGPNGAMLTWPNSVGVQMTSQGPLGHLVVYTPKGQPFFCVEPTSHSPNAVNSSLPTRQTGLIVLEPGETTRATITLSVALPTR